MPCAKDVKALRQTLKNNNMTGEKSYIEADKIQGTLDSIAQTELPQITPKLADARNELAKAEGQMPKDVLKSQKKLDEAGRLQDSVLKALRELLKDLNPEIKMNELAAQAKNLLDKQKALQQQTEELKQAQTGNSTPPRRKFWTRVKRKPSPRFVSNSKSLPTRWISSFRT